MSCERCGGLMVVETCCDLIEAESRKGIDTMRCVNCGNFEDAIIRTNRASSRVPRHVAPLPRSNDRKAERCSATVV